MMQDGRAQGVFRHGSSAAADGDGDDRDAG